MKTLKTTLAIAALILSSASASSAHAGLFEDIADVIAIEVDPVLEPDIREPEVTDCFPNLPPDVRGTEPIGDSNRIEQDAFLDELRHLSSIVDSDSHVAKLLD